MMGFSSVLPPNSSGGGVVLHREPAIELVDVAEVADEIPEERYPPVIEMREVDAGAEHAAVLVFRMLDHAAAQHDDLDLRIEQRKIDADLNTVERGLILGVEEARIVVGEDRGLAAPLDRGAGKLRLSLLDEFRQLIDRLRRAAAAWRGTDAGPTARFAAPPRRTGPDRSPARPSRPAAVLPRRRCPWARHQARHELRRRRHQILQPHKARPLGGERVVDRIDVRAQERSRASRAASTDQPRRQVFDRALPRRRRQLAEQPGGLLPEARKRLAVGGETFRPCAVALSSRPPPLGQTARRHEQFIVVPGAGGRHHRTLLERRGFTEPAPLLL